MKTNFDLVKDRPVVMDGIDMTMPYKIFPTVKDFVDFLNLTVEEKILDDDEKRYIKNIVRPFWKKVIYVSKERSYEDNSLEYIDIVYREGNNNDNLTEHLCFPYFTTLSMYKNMEISKEYTLKELGITFKN